MRRLRTRRSLVLFSIGVAVLSAFLPLFGSQFFAIFVPLWIIAPVVVATSIRRRPTRCDEQPLSLLSVLPARAPPLVASPASLA